MRRYISIVLVSVVLFLQTGCWNAREINELAFVLSIGLDKADDGYIVTAQIAKPETYSKTPSGGVGTTEKEKPFWIVIGEGKTIFEAVRNMAAVSSRRIFWSHIKVIIIGEELARSDIHEIFDFFSRNPELRFRTWIAVTPDKAGKVLEVLPIMEKDPSQNIEKIIEKTNLTGKACGIMLKDFLEDYLNPYMNPVASRILVTTQNSKPVVKLEGAAAFDGRKFAEWLDGEQTRGFLWIDNKINGSIRVVDCPYDGLPVTLEIKKGKTKIKSNITDGLPSFTITANVSAKLTEKACLTEFTNTQALNSLEEALSSAVEEDIRAAVTEAQDHNTDFIGFSSVLQREHKKEWNDISSNWSKIFSQADIKIEVKAKIPEISLLAKSLVPIKAPGAR